MQLLRLSGLILTAWMALNACSPENLTTLSSTEEENPLRYDEYDVRFTNPSCRHYRYTDPVPSVKGDLLKQKPKNVFCKQSDAAASESRSRAPYQKIKSWLEDESTHSVFATFLSFSHRKTRDLLCQALQRGVNVTLILDSGTRLSAAESLNECTGPESGTFDFQTRGGEKGIGYAHNKVLMINAEDATMKLAFGSANLSSGVGLHHENWHFVTLPTDTYFAQSHICLRDGMLYSGNSKRDYRSFIKSCRADIPYPRETDIQNFFVPAEGDLALAAIEQQLESAQSLDMAMHRFSSKELIALMQERMETGPLPLRMIADDDLYWASQGRSTGPNRRSEFYRVAKFLDEGAQIRYMETNHNSRLLHHNKFMIFRGETVNAVFTGAGNFTSTAFNENFENFYMITIPHVKQRFAWQYWHMWTQLASDPEDLPTENVMP